MSTRTNAWDRRDFLAAAAGAAAVAYLPFGSAAVAPAVGATGRQDLAADWSIDDQWGVYPRYDAISQLSVHLEDPRLAAVHPADVQFLV